MLRENYWYFSHRDQFNDPLDFHVSWTLKAPDSIEKIKKRISEYSPRFERFCNNFEATTAASTVLTLALDEKILTLEQIDIMFGSDDNPFRKISDYQEKLGILCMSLNCSSMALFSHYANGHRGACIEYDGDAISADFKQRGINCQGAKVDYIDEMPSPFFLEDSGEGMQNQKYQDDLKAQIFSKHKIWSAEDEFRLVLTPRPENSLERCSSKKVKLPNNAVKRIIFGHRATSKFKKSVIKAMKGKQVVFQQAIIIHDQYNHLEFSPIRIDLR